MAQRSLFAKSGEISPIMVTLNLVAFWPQRLEKCGPKKRKSCCLLSCQFFDAMLPTCETDVVKIYTLGRLICLKFCNAMHRR